jgi:hypothetical protein
MKSIYKMVLIMALSIMLTGCDDGCNSLDDFLFIAFGGFEQSYPLPPPPSTPDPTPDPPRPNADCTSRDAKGQPQCPGIVP